jgi:DNA topoisomerase-1
MDRVVGFPLSNLLGKKVAAKLSAGRVQSVAVKLIVDRELEIEAFKTEEYWKITALLAPQGLAGGYAADPKKAKLFAKKKPGDAAEKAEPETEQTEQAEAATAERELADGPPEAGAAGPAEKAGLPTPPAGSFLAELAKWDSADPVLTSEADADRIVAALQGVPFVVTRIEQKDRQERPQAPFTTSTLQQQANIRLRFTTSRTMQTAQKLYEGVDLGSEGGPTVRGCPPTPCGWCGTTSRPRSRPRTCRPSRTTTPRARPPRRPTRPSARPT